MAEAFQYKIVSKEYAYGDAFETETNESEMNAFGAEGWELIHIMHDASRSTTNIWTIWYFKRRIPPKAVEWKGSGA